MRNGRHDHLDRPDALLNQRQDKVTLAIFFLGNTPIIDLAGAEMLTEILEAMKGRGIRFRLAEAHGDVRDALRRADFEKHYGPVEANQTVAEVIARAEEMAVARP